VLLFRLLLGGGGELLRLRIGTGRVRMTSFCEKAGFSVFSSVGNVR